MGTSTSVLFHAKNHRSKILQDKNNKELNFIDKILDNFEPLFWLDSIFRLNIMENKRIIGITNCQTDLWY